MLSAGLPEPDFRFGFSKNSKRRAGTLDAVRGTEDRVEKFLVAALSFQLQQRRFHILKVLGSFFEKGGSKSIQVNLHGKGSDFKRVPRIRSPHD